jgi:hypothetical protein
VYEYGIYYEYFVNVCEALMYIFVENVLRREGSRSGLPAGSPHLSHH